MVIKVDEGIILQGWPGPCSGHNFYDTNADARFVSSSYSCFTSAKEGVFSPIVYLFAC